MDSAITMQSHPSVSPVPYSEASAPICQVPQSTSCSPDVVGVSFATDIIKRNRQLIAVVRETVTSYTVTCLIATAGHSTLIVHWPTSP